MRSQEKLFIATALIEVGTGISLAHPMKNGLM
jgi:hypothetical protein